VVDTEEEVVQFESRATQFRNEKPDIYKMKGKKKQESIELGRMLECLK